VQVKVLNVDAPNRRISLGLKQLSEDPWEKIAERYVAGGNVVGTVTRFAPFGVFLELEPDNRGTRARLRTGPPTGPQSGGDVQDRDALECKILKVTPEERKIALSARRCSRAPAPSSAVRFAFIVNPRAGAAVFRRCSAPARPYWAA